MLEPTRCRRTIGADKGYDMPDFIADARALGFTMHVSPPNPHRYRGRLLAWGDEIGPPVIFARGRRPIGELAHGDGVECLSKVSLDDLHARDEERLVGSAESRRRSGVMLVVRGQIVAARSQENTRYRKVRHRRRFLARRELIGKRHRADRAENRMISRRVAVKRSARE